MLRKTLLALLGVALSVSSAYAQYWTWSPKGQDHHAAVCQVRSGRNGGSGVYVEYSGVRGVLTARHVVTSPTATVTFGDGTTATGNVTTDRYGYDIGFIFVTVSKTPVRIATRPPTSGERVEYVTYGGPSNRTLRHFYAVYQGTGVTDAYVTSGDSGGAIFNSRGEVFAIQSVGRSHAIADNGGGQFPVYKGSGFAPNSATTHFVQRVAARYSQGGYEKVCGPGGCYLLPRRRAAPRAAPQYYPAPGGDGGQGGQEPREVDVTIDYGKLAAVLVERYGDRLRGPQGKPGRDGADGSNGQDGKPGEANVDYNRLAAVLARDHADRLRGEPGEPGSPANVDLDKLAAAVQSRLPPISVYVAGDSGGATIPLQDVRLGETLTLPPVRMEIEYPDDGTVTYQSRPLGEAIRVRLVPLGN